MKEVILTDHQLRVLAEGLVRGGVLPVDVAYKVYASDESARNSIMSLESWGFIKQSNVPGVFIVVKAPDDAFIIADNLKKSRGLDEGEEDKEA